MKYFGPEIILPLSESGFSPSLQKVDNIADAELVLADDVSGFLKDKDVVLFSADASLLNSCRNGVLLGGHFLSGKEREFLKAKNIKFFPVNSIIHEGISNVCDAVMEASRSFSSFCLCVSLSVVELPGGLSVRELLYFLQRLRVLKNYSCACVLGSPSVLTGKLLSELAKPF
ncbi:hypothetical protein KY309_01890 [Candidatus Woesearchaeota archaeon]|nr:hypothetical protein [Candidatus Woesearchaeota archaeon]